MFCGLSFQAFVFSYLPGKPCFCSGYVRFQLLACFRRQEHRRVFSGQARTGGGGGGGGGCFPWSGRFMCVLALLPVWYYGVELIPLSLLLLLVSAYSMARGQEDTSTSQAGRRRGPIRVTPSASSIISSLSMEELRSYCQIPNNIDFELPNGPTEPTVDEEDSVVYFTREQLAVGLCFPISSLVKQFLHLFRAPPALIHPNVIRINTGCSVPNLLYQLDISLVEVYFIYTLKLGHGGRLSMSA